MNISKSLRTALTILLAILLCCGCTAKTMPPSPTEAPNLRPSPEPASSESPAPYSGPDYGSIITESFAGFDGQYSYSFHHYGADVRFANESKKMKSASVIKLFIMEYAYSRVVAGELKTDDQISGQTLASLIEAMITVSDNNATNILIEHFTMEKLNDFFVSCQYTDTVLQRKMLDTAAVARGEENYTSASDVTAFLDKLYANKDNFPYNEMLDVMKRQKIATKLRRDMPAGIEMASKTGELSDTENDVALVFTSNGDYAIVCLTSGGTATAARNAMAVTCRKLYDTILGE